MSDFDLVKSQVDIVSYIQRNVSLKKAGSIYKALCPFHPEKTPSFTVNPKTQQWKCWGACGVGGSVIDFAMKYHHMTESEALQDVASFANVPLTPLNREKADKKERLYALMEAATQIYQGILFGITGKPYLKYLQQERGLSIDTIKAARMGYAPPGGIDVVKGFTHQDMVDADLIVVPEKGAPYQRFWSRIMIPILDHKGRVVAFTGRTTQADKTPKYMHNTTTDIFEKSKIIHRMPLNQSTIGFEAFDTIVMVEGSLDPVSAFNRGVFNVVALLGKECTDGQVELLCKTGAKRLVFCLDRDESGRKALRTLTVKHKASLASQGIELYAMFAPHGKDPDDTFREKPELWQPSVDAARPVVDVLIDLELSPLSKSATAVEKTKAAIELMPTLRSDNPMVQQENLGKLASRLNVTPAEMERWANPKMVVHQPAPKQETYGAPTSEEWVLHGILCYEADGWLARANACILIASDDMMPYALAPLGTDDFTDRDTKRLMDLVLKARQAGETFADYLHEHVDRPLQAPYKRVVDLDEIGKTFLMPFDYEIFIHYVYEVRIKRLIRDRAAFEAKEPAKARECAMAIACLRLAQEDLLDTI